MEQETGKHERERIGEKEGQVKEPWVSWKEGKEKNGNHCPGRLEGSRNLN